MQTFCLHSFSYKCKKNHADIYCIMYTDVALGTLQQGLTVERLGTLLSRVVHRSIFIDLFCQILVPLIRIFHHLEWPETLSMFWYHFCTGHFVAFSALTLLVGRPVKKVSGRVLVWLSVWGEMRILIWPSWCHCYSLSLAPVIPDWFWFCLSGTGSPG